MSIGPQQRTQVFDGACELDPAPIASDRFKEASDINACGIPQDSHLGLGWMGSEAGSQSQQPKGRGEELEVRDQVLQDAAKIIRKCFEMQLPRDSHAKVPQEGVQCNGEQRA